MSLTRVTQNRSGKISITLQNAEGVATDPTPDTASIEILRDDGTTLVAAGTPATNVTGSPGRFEYVLAPTDTAKLDLLSARWKATVDSYLQVFETRVEVCGGHLFSVGQLRQEEGDEFTGEEIAAARVLAEDFLEHACGVAFTPRYRRDTLDGPGGRDLLLPTPRVLSVQAVSIDGVALTTPELDELRVRGDAGVLVRPGGWPRGDTSIEVTWTHGYPSPHPLASRPAMRIADRILSSPTSALSERATSVHTDAGTQVLLVAGLRGMVSDIPEVNAFIAEHAYRGGFA